MIKKKRSVLWLIVWGIALVLSTYIFTFYRIYNYFLTGVYINAAKPMLTVLFLCLCCVLLPSLSLSLYCAYKDKNKVIKVVAICLIVHHLLCIISLIPQIM